MFLEKNVKAELEVWLSCFELKTLIALVGSSTQPLNVAEWKNEKESLNPKGWITNTKMWIFHMVPSRVALVNKARGSLYGSVFAETLQYQWILGLEWPRPFVVEAVGKQFLRGWVRWQTEDWEEGELKKCNSQGGQMWEALAQKVRQGRLEEFLGQKVLKWKAVTGERLGFQGFLVFYAKRPFWV